MSPFNLFSLAVLFDDDESYDGCNPIFRRFFAIVIDICAIFSFIWLLSLIPIDSIVNEMPREAFALLVSPLIIILFAVMESSNFRASPGKLFTALVTVNNKGGKLNFSRSLIRNMIKWLPIFVSVLFTVLLKIDIPELAGFWIVLTCFTVFTGWGTLYGFITGSTVYCRPSIYKLHHRPDDIIIG